MMQNYIPNNTITTSGGNNCNYLFAEGAMSGPNTTATGFGFFSLEFFLNDLPQVTSFSNLFDQYRINWVKVVFEPQLTMSNFAIPAAAGGVNFNTYYQKLGTVIDRDDNSLLPSLNAALEYDTYVETNFNKRHTRKLKPNPTIALYAGGAFSGYGFNDNWPDVNPWLDMASVSIPHYGIKGVIYTANTAADQVQNVWTIRVKMSVSFRNVR